MYKQDRHMRSQGGPLFTVGETAAGDETAPTKLASASAQISAERAQSAIIPRDTVDSRQAYVPAPLQADLGPDAALPPFPDKFPASIAHKLNERLATIVMKGETCLRSLGSEKPQIELARAGIATMVEDALRLGDIIRHVSALSIEAEVARKRSA